VRPKFDKCDANDSDATGKPRTRLTRKIDAVAKAFGVTNQTIRRWHNEGCNIFDPGELSFWREKKIENRRHGRGDLDAALNGHRQDSAGMLNMEIIDKLPAPTGEGAAAALRRLQGLESIFYSRQLEALAKGRSDLISFALTDYRKITESLRMYEREVEAAMRDSGQLISRGEAERGAAAVARWFRLGWRLWLSASIPDLLPLASDPRAFKAKAEETFAEIMAQVFLKAREAKLPVPVWATGAIRDEFRSEVQGENVPQSDPMG
jgi:hypothetical protein